MIVNSASARFDGFRCSEHLVTLAAKGVCARSSSCENVVMQDFRRLAVWARAHKLVLGVRRSARSFPRGDRGSLKTQMVSSAESVAFNIVEGAGASGAKEFARFLDISIKSTGELEYQLELATDADLMAAHVSRPLMAEAVEIRRMLCGLRRKVLEPRPSADTGN